MNKAKRHQKYLERAQREPQYNGVFLKQHGVVPRRLHGRLYKVKRFQDASPKPTP